MYAKLVEVRIWLAFDENTSVIELVVVTRENVIVRRFGAFTQCLHHQFLIVYSRWLP